MNAGIYGGIAWLELERQCKERERSVIPENKVCDDCPLFYEGSQRKHCCGEQIRENND